MGQLASGVTAITTVTEEGFHGFTATSLCRLSDDPPLALVCADRLSRGRDYLLASGVFVVSLLSAQQEFLAERLAGRAPGLTRRFEGVRYLPAPGGAPILLGSLGWLDCRLQASHEVGDHTLCIGRVVAAGLGEAQVPLLYFRSAYARLREA